ncbi:single-stranded DNA-binding protein [Saccharicrinis sp. FJH2]|uniref:single-stranded DNA-binding protein n=1 Tax=unclassified Saccharicrinis TaxID=2646859 RepID=UPI0035D42B15
MSVNKVILVGNVGKDPDIRYIDQDLAVASFSLATTERGFTRRDGTQVPDSTEWHNIVAWRGLAKLAESYIVKGTQLYIEGKLRTRSYDDQNGVKKYTTEIVADTIQLLGRKADNPATDSGSTSAPAQAKQTAGNSSQQENSQPFEADDSSEDDLPF